MNVENHVENPNPADYRSCVVIDPETAEVLYDFDFGRGEALGIAQVSYDTRLFRLMSNKRHYEAMTARVLRTPHRYVKVIYFA